MVSQGCPPQPRLRAVRPRCLLCRGVRRTPEPLQIGEMASQGRCTRAPTRTTQPQYLAELPAQEVAIATIIDIFSLAKWCNITVMLKNAFEPYVSKISTQNFAYNL